MDNAYDSNCILQNTHKLGEGQGRTRTDNCPNMLSPYEFAVIALHFAADHRADSDKKKNEGMAAGVNSRVSRVWAELIGLIVSFSHVASW